MRPQRVERAIERRFPSPPPVKVAMPAGDAPRDQREPIDPRPQLDRAQARLAGGARPSRPACSSTCSASDTPQAGRSNRRTTRLVRAPGAPRRAGALDGARARAPACSTRARKLPSANGIETPSKVSNRASVRVRNRASGESGTSMPTHSTCGSRARKTSTELAGAAAEVEHPPRPSVAASDLPFDVAVGERLASMIVRHGIAEQLFEVAAGQPHRRWF